MSSGPSIMAGGPLRARLRLRCAWPDGSRHLPTRTRSLENLAPGPCAPRSSCRSKSRLPEGEEAGNPRPPAEKGHHHDGTAAPTSTVEADDSATAVQVGSLEHLDPNAAEVGENVRDAVDLSKEFLASLRERV